MPGIFEQSFNTPLPNTDIAGQLVALRMRNEAMKPDGVIKGLSQVGKVFTDAAEEQRAANTALLQRKLDMLNPAQIEQMITQGIDPVAEAYNADIPINVDDEALNKAWRANIIDAQTAQGNKWVTTVLPTIPFKDKIALLHGDASVYKKYGLTDFMRMSPELRTFIHDSIQDAATFEAEKQAANLRQSPSYLIETEQTPKSYTYSHLDEDVAATANRANINADLSTEEATIKKLIEDQATSSAYQGVAPVPEPGTLLYGANFNTPANVALIEGAYTTDLERVYDTWAAQPQNVGKKYDDFIQSPEAQQITQKLAEQIRKINPGRTEEDYLKLTDNAIRKAHLGVFTRKGDPDSAGKNANSIALNTPYESPVDITSDNVLDVIQKRNAALSRNPTLAQSYDRQLKEFFRNDLLQDIGKDLYAKLAAGATKQEIAGLKQQELNVLAQGKGKINQLKYKELEGTINSVFDEYEKLALDNDAQKVAAVKARKKQARDRLRGSDSVLGKYITEGRFEVPDDMKEVDKNALEAIKSTFLKNNELSAIWANADIHTKKLIAWYTLDYVGILRDHSFKLKDTEKLNDRLIKNRHNTGINDQNFINTIQNIFWADLSNTSENQINQEDISRRVAKGATKEINQ